MLRQCVLITELSAPKGFPWDCCTQPVSTASTDRGAASVASGCRVQAMYRAQLQVSRACCCRTAWPNRCCKSFSVKPRGSSEGSLCPGLTPGLPAGRSADQAARRAVLTNLHVCIRKKGLCLSVSHQTELMHLSACFLTFTTFSM